MIRYQQHLNLPGVGPCNHRDFANERSARNQPGAHGAGASLPSHTDAPVSFSTDGVKTEQMDSAAVDGRDRLGKGSVAPNPISDAGADDLISAHRDGAGRVAGAVFLPEDHAQHSLLFKLGFVGLGLGLLILSLWKYL